MVENEGQRVQLTDSMLLAGLRSGERDAFEPLFNRHWRTVYGVLFRLTGSREEAEDLAQEVFVRLYRNPPALGNQPSLAPWLYRVATNLGYNALRKGTREARRQERVQRLADTEQAAGLGAVDPEQESMAQEERLAVRKALAQLSEREQACLVLRHSGLSYAEVASALGVRTGSVGTLLARAEERFRRVYESLRGGA
ncbi:MAG: sigma-70 family RNA polymerase sigma factor [Chloroflexota bacterium]